MSEITRVRAKVKRYNKERGFGFLQNDCVREYGKDIFFHISEFSNEIPDVGDIVEFEFSYAKLGLKAVRCKIVSSGPKEI
jgi:cold shock CspA family protein